MKFRTTQIIVYVGLLTALQIILSRFAGVQTPIMHISFAFLPLSLTAVLFGAVPAMISAAIGDIISALLYPGMAYFPGFTLSAILTGLVYGLLLYNRPRSLWRISLAVLLVNIPISLFLSTYWVYLITGRGFLALLPARIFQNVVLVPVKISMIWGVVYRVLPLALRGAAPTAASQKGAAPRP